jgi:hypothetical protein
MVDLGKWGNGESEAGQRFPAGLSRLRVFLHRPDRMRLTFVHTSLKKDFAISSINHYKQLQRVKKVLQI